MILCESPNPPGPQQCQYCVQLALAWPARTQASIPVCDLCPSAKTREDEIISLVSERQLINV